MIQKLRDTRIGVLPEREDQELAFLQKLPKTDLHCHLGGVAQASEIIEIAAANRIEIMEYHDFLTPWQDAWKRRIHDKSLEKQHFKTDFKALRTAVPQVPGHLCVAAFVLLFEDRPERLDQLIYGPCLDERTFQNVGFNQYEKFGDLQGSGLLQTRASLEAACRILIRNAARNNVRYLELRCSPANYVHGGLKALDVVRIIDGSLSDRKQMDYGLIFTASRHGSMARVHEHIKLAKELFDSTANGFQSLLGFDLAGEETAAKAGEMRKLFMPMMEKCMHLTIHAGETADVNSIWEAVYHLSAERIGHGLTLKENPALMDRFRDRGIALEMCPSSNMQIVGFRDNYYPETASRQIYPLKQYLDAGLRVTVNTDNPGISKTDPSRELLQAARMTPGGLSLWEILLLVRNGFKAGFAGKSERQKLLRKAEKDIVNVLENDMGGFRLE
jgi:adenosine deaminase